MKRSNVTLLCENAKLGFLFAIETFNVSALNAFSTPSAMIGVILFPYKKIDKLVYWSIKGKGDEKIQEIDSNISELVDRGKDGIKRLIARFNVFENPYIATAFDLNDQNHYASDYKHLSRVEEWGYL